MENQEKVQDVKELDLSAENALQAIAATVLIGGIISTIICLFTIVAVDSGKYEYIDDKVFNPAGLATTIGVLLISLTIWASLKVLSNISVSLKVINTKK
ncbi:MAG: hypothetical protein QNL21_09115 [Flavobacteriales bacterium]